MLDNDKSGRGQVSMIQRFEAYLLKLRETPLAERTEHTGCAALEGLLNAFAGEARAKDVRGGDALAFTIDQMARIDTAYRAAFPEQA